MDLGGEDLFYSFTITFFFKLHTVVTGHMLYLQKENCEGNQVFRAGLPLPELQFLNLAENKVGLLLYMKDSSSSSASSV